MMTIGNIESYLYSNDLVETVNNLDKIKNKKVSTDTENLINFISEYRKRKRMKKTEEDNQKK